MADENGSTSNDSGSKDRATVALVDAKVSAVDAKVDGVRDLIKAEFLTIKEDVKALGAIVGDVLKHGILLQEHERRLQKIEDEDSRSRASRPGLVLGVIAVLVAMGALAAQFFH